jgi:hypothetical protein
MKKCAQEKATPIQIPLTLAAVTSSTEQVKLVMVHDRTATGVLRVV